MAGSRRNDYYSSASAGEGASGQDDACALAFDVDLSSVDMEQVITIAEGSVLPVRIMKVKGYTIVACLSPSGEPVGTLAAFPGLADLKGCLERGRIYDAFVEKIEVAAVSVHVELKR